MRLEPIHTINSFQHHEPIALKPDVSEKTKGYEEVSKSSPELKNFSHLQEATSENEKQLTDGEKIRELVKSILRNNSIAQSLSAGTGQWTAQEISDLKLGDRNCQFTKKVSQPMDEKQVRSFIKCLPGILELCKQGEKKSLRVSLDTLKGLYGLTPGYLFLAMGEGFKQNNQPKMGEIFQEIGEYITDYGKNYGKIEAVDDKSTGWWIFHYPAQESDWLENVQLAQKQTAQKFQQHIQSLNIKDLDSTIPFPGVSLPLLNEDFLPQALKKFLKTAREDFRKIREEIINLKNTAEQNGFQTIDLKASRLRINGLGEKNEKKTLISILNDYGLLSDIIDIQNNTVSEKGKITSITSGVITLESAENILNKLLEIPDNYEAMFALGEKAKFIHTEILQDLLEKNSSQQPVRPNMNRVVRRG